VFAFTFKEENIIIMGGLKQFSGQMSRSVGEASAKTKQPEYEIDNNVYLYNQ